MSADMTLLFSADRRAGGDGSRSSRPHLCAWMSYARCVARLGYRVLSLNFQGYAPIRTLSRRLA